MRGRSGREAGHRVRVWEQASPAGNEHAPELAVQMATGLRRHAQVAHGPFTGEVCVRGVCLVKLWENKNAPAKGVFSADISTGKRG